MGRCLFYCCLEGHLECLNTHEKDVLGINMLVLMLPKMVASSV